MKHRPVISGVALFGLVAALIALAVSQVTWPPRVDTRLHQEIGRALAAEALKLRGPQGQITLIVRDTASFPQPAADIARASIEQELKRAGVLIRSVHLLQEDPLRPPQVPPGDFFELLRRGASGDVILSLMGPPLLNEEQRALLGTPKPKVVAFLPGAQPEQLNLRWLAEQGLLQAAVMGRPPSQWVAGRESFADLYVRAGPEDLLRSSGAPALAGKELP